MSRLYYSLLQAHGGSSKTFTSTSCRVCGSEEEEEEDVWKQEGCCDFSISRFLSGWILTSPPGENDVSQELFIEKINK